MFLIMTSKFLDLSSDPSFFDIRNIFLDYVQLNFSAVFEDTIFYEISEDFWSLLNYVPYVPTCLTCLCA